jgi:hypothetical protein
MRKGPDFWVSLFTPKSPLFSDEFQKSEPGLRTETHGGNPPHGPR